MKYQSRNVQTIIQSAEDEEMKYCIIKITKRKDYDNSMKKKNKVEEMENMNKYEDLF